MIPNFTCARFAHKCIWCVNECIVWSPGLKWVIIRKIDSETKGAGKERDTSVFYKLLLSVWIASKSWAAWQLPPSHMVELRTAASLWQHWLLHQTARIKQSILWHAPQSTPISTLRHKNVSMAGRNTGFPFTNISGATQKKQKPKTRHTHPKNKPTSVLVRTKS